MSRLALIAALLLAAAPAMAQSFTTSRDVLGNTIYSGQGFSGRSSTDVLGNVQSTFQSGGQTTSCTSSRDVLGNIQTSCR